MHKCAHRRRAIFHRMDKTTNFLSYYEQKIVELSIVHVRVDSCVLDSQKCVLILTMHIILESKQ